MKVTELESKAGDNRSSEGRHCRAQSRDVLPEEHFHRMICLERKRAERSGKPFLLMLLDTGRVAPSEKNSKVLQNVFAALALSTRDTDVIGWYKDRSVVGVMFTEIAVDLKKSILGTMLVRVSSALRDSLTLEQFSQINISFHLFPEEWGEETPTRSAGLRALSRSAAGRRPQALVAGASSGPWMWPERWPRLRCSHPCSW